ncbi:MAG: hypothetical protein KDE35_10740 [Geminicoccaceae bacterium]|nr:hypothetical protein [Geminicoccaceae bacterium]
MFLRFDSERERDAFVETVRQKEPQASARLRVSKSTPTVVTIRAANANETARLSRIARGRARIHGDFECRTFHDPSDTGPVGSPAT